LAALCTIWSYATRLKFQVMNSMIGRRPGHRGADAQPGEAVLGDRGVDHPAGAELGEHALRHLVGAVVVGDLFAHEEHALVAPHLLGHRAAERLAQLELGHQGPRRRCWSRCSRRASPDRGSARLVREVVGVLGEDFDPRGHRVELLGGDAVLCLELASASS
jgi:hypothetical protein